MSSDEHNPYERYDIDPLGGPAAITERLRGLIEQADDEEDKRAIRAAWEELTLHPARRLRAALGAHPDSHRRASSRPAPPAARRPEALEPALSDLVLRPSIAAALGVSETPELPSVPLSEDPALS